MTSASSALFALLLGLTTGPVASAQTTAAATAIPQSLSTTLQLGDQALQLGYLLSLLPPDPAAPARVRIRVELDLGQLYAPLQQWLDQELPRQRCARPGKESWTAGPAELELAVDAGTLALHAGLPVQLWWCERLLGRQLKANLDGWAELSLPLQLQVEEQQLRLRLLPVRAQADGVLGDAAEGWLRLRGERIGERIDQRLAGASLGQRSWMLPTALRLLDVRLESAQFIQRDGIPAAELVLSSRLDPAHWLGLWLRIGSSHQD